jgi:glutathione S-transferase
VKRTNEDDDGFILYESRAICHYIASKYSDQGTPLLPTELKANTLFHQAASLEAFHFDGPAVVAIVERMLNP